MYEVDKSYSSLLNLQFDINGCTDNRIINFGGVSFREPSPIPNVREEARLRCATFDLYDDSAGLMINDQDITSALASKDKDLTIYFKYKIRKEDIEKYSTVPILAAREDNNNPYHYSILSIVDGSYFKFSVNKDEYFNSPDISYTFDGKWHTFTLCRYEYFYRHDVYNMPKVIKIFIDGCHRAGYDSGPVQCRNTIDPDNYSYQLKDGSFQPELFIGWQVDKDNKIITFNGGSIDNLYISGFSAYNESFIPPTNYFYGADIKENYYMNIEANTLNVGDETIKELEYQAQFSKYHFNEAQKDYLPRRIRIEWWQQTHYFEHEEDKRTRRHHRPETIITVRLLENFMDSYNNRFVKDNILNLYKKNLIQPFMLFVDGNLVPFSKMNIIKSDDYFQIFIADRDHDDNKRVESVEVVTIPFPVLYEEGRGERANLTPLYVFDSKGRFTTDGGYIYYYISPKANKHLKCRGISEQSFGNDNNTGDNSDPFGAGNDVNYMHFLWRYGRFDQATVSGSSCFITFNPIDGCGPITPNDNVILYKNTTQIDPSRYRIVGNNKIEFLNYNTQHLVDDFITMQVITDSYGNNVNLLEDYTSVRFVSVTATKNNQSVFVIPTVTDNDGFLYKKFLLFRGSVCMENNNRYIVDRVRNTITFTNMDDFVPVGTSLLFVFIKLKIGDQYGPLHVKPIFLYTATSHNLVGGSTRYIAIPYYKGLKFNHNNLMMFINNTFINPRRYEIVDNKAIQMRDPNDKIPIDKSITFVLLKKANEFEDPTDKRGDIIKDLMQKGYRYVLYDLNIDKRRRITLDNFITFDQNGRYLPDLYGRVYSTNIIKYLRSGKPLERVPRYLTCVYYDDSLENTSNAVKFDNTQFIKDYISLREEFYELDENFDNFIKDFNITHSQDLHYGVNLAKALDYIVRYNQNLLDGMYEKNSSCTRTTYNIKQLNKNMKPVAGGFKLIFYGDETYKYHGHHSKNLFFVNGELAPWNKNVISKNNHSVVVVPNKFNENDVVESIRFHNIKNFLAPLKTVLTKSNQSNGFFTCTMKVGNTLDKEFTCMIEVERYSEE